MWHAFIALCKHALHASLLAGLLQDCKGCCQDEESSSGSQKFVSAVLEICKLRLR